MSVPSVDSPLPETNDIPLGGRSLPRDSQARARLSRRRFLTGAGLTLAGFGVYASEISRHELEIVPRDIHIQRLPQPFHNFRIAQLSDIHLEEYTEETFLRYAVHRINDLKPDMVLLTGDYVSDGPRSPSYALKAALRCGAILRELACPLRYAVLGNHDFNVDPPFVTAALVSNGIPVLSNQFVAVKRGGAHLWLSGLEDAGAGRPNLDLSIPPQLDAPLLMMCHEPDYTDTILRHPRGTQIDLILSGHTHGGQVRLPFLPPLILPSMGTKYVEGLFHFNKTQLYVNRGLGAVGLPVRFNCPPEITILKLKPA